jgi:hypothetical protein
MKKVEKLNLEKSSAAFLAAVSILAHKMRKKES